MFSFFSFNEELNKLFFNNRFLIINNDLIFIYFLIHNFNNSLRFNLILKYYYSNFKIKYSISLIN